MHPLILNDIKDLNGYDKSSSRSFGIDNAHEMIKQSYSSSIEDRIH